MNTEFDDLRNKVVLITGGSGVLGSSMAKSLVEADMKVAITYRSGLMVKEKVENWNKKGRNALAIPIDVLDAESIESGKRSVLDKWGSIDVLINAAGGNVPGTVIPSDKSVFDLSLEAILNVLDLNLFGTVVPTLSMGKLMAEQGHGSIINISSMASSHSISRVIGYSMAKAGIDNFTKWMAMEMATKYGDGIRVNAIAPGFFISKQNKDILIDEHGNYTDRANKIMNNTPMGRFGKPEELNGIVQFLCSDASKFMTGAVIPIDGGFSSFSGV
ncbi:MAG: SDR family oxidoreductase [Cytophagales bacterium]|nr:SDR family oxidoreductase [Cytophagales bacterium]